MGLVENKFSWEGTSCICTGVLNFNCPKDCIVILGNEIINLVRLFVV